MYTPVQFKVDEAAEAHALMRAHAFAILITHGADGVVATHLPTVLKVDEANPLGRIECHVARPNPQWKAFSPDTDALMIFQGAEAYIRPGWYPSKSQHGKAVPTWNYAMVQAHGRLRAIEDAAWLEAFVTRLTGRHEAGRAQPWHVADAPADFLDSMLRAIVGIEIEVTRIEGKFKLSQNRPAEDRQAVVEGLRADAADGLQRDALRTAQAMIDVELRRDGDTGSGLKT